MKPDHKLNGLQRCLSRTTRRTLPAWPLVARILAIGTAAFLAGGLAIVAILKSCAP